MQLEVLKKQKLSNSLNTLLANIKSTLTRGSKISHINKTWADLMISLSHFNINKETYGLNCIEFTSYGFTSEVKIPSGYDKSDLESLRSKIETAFNCTFDCSKMLEKDIVKCSFITKTNPNKWYKKVTLDKPYHVYIGDSLSGEPIIIDMLKNPNILDVGAPRQGKTFLMKTALINLAKNFTKEEVEFYLMQVDRADFVTLEDNPCTTRYEEMDYPKLLEMLEDLKCIVEERVQIIRPYMKNGTASNFAEYNKISDKKMSVIYLAVDEMVSLRTRTDAKTKKDREAIDSALEFISSKGQSCGVFCILSLQRPDAQSLNTVIKSNCSVPLSFNVNNSKSSEIVMDDPYIALNLKERHFVYKLNGEFMFGVVPLVNREDLKG